MKRNLEQRVEIVAPVEAPALRAELRTLLDLHLADQRGAWDMQPDGSYVQRRPEDPDAPGCQQQLIALAEERLRSAMRLRRRKPQVIVRRHRQSH